MDKRINKNMKNTLVIGIIIILLGVTMAPAVNSSNIIANMKIGNLQENNEETQITTTGNGKTNYYAVLAGCSKYEDAGNNLPISAWNLKALNRALMQANLDLEWENDWDIKCLINEDARKDDILNALDWAAANVDDNDVFLFSWQGHGSEVPDDNGDESGFLDNYDEVICPYDCYRDYRTNELFNYITDDLLDEKFDAIQAKNPKGMLLMFESCLSGGLVDQNVLDLIVGSDGVLEESEASDYNEAYKQDFVSRTLDPDGPGRIILVSTSAALGNTLGRGSWIFGFTMTWTMAHALKKGIFGPANDKNHDGWISAEEAFSWSQPRIILENSAIWVTIWTVFFVEEYGFAKLYGDPNPFDVALNATLWTMFEFCYVQLISRLAYGHFMLNWANIVDQYDGELPLIKLNPLGGVPDEDDEDIEIPGLPTGIWTEHPAYNDLSDAFQSAVTEEQYNSYFFRDDLDQQDWPQLETKIAYSKNNLEVSFQGQAINGPPEYTYAWDFGDGTTSNEQNPIHTYEEKDTYSVALTVTDDADRTAQKTLSIKAGSKSGSKTLDLMEKLTQQMPLLRLLLQLPMFKKLLGV